MSLKIFLLLTTFSFILISSSYAHSGQVLKTLTLNFNSEEVLQDKSSQIRDARFKSIQEWVKQNEPDIIFIQEGWNYHGMPSVIVPLAKIIDYDYAYRVGEGIPFLLADSSGILVKKSLHLTQTRNFELPYGKSEIGNGGGWVLPLGANSYAVGGRITLEDGSSLYAYSTHLISNGDTGAVAGLNAIHQTILNQALSNGENPENMRSIIAGDFNSKPNDPGLIAIKSLGYRDTFAEAHPGLETAENSCTLCMDPHSVYFNPVTISPAQFPKQAEIGGNDRIDYILARGPQIKTLASTVVFTKPIHHVWMSDHMGVMSTVAVGEVPAAEDYPNPLRDNENTKTSLIIHLNHENIHCENSTNCTSILPDSEIDPSLGVTFINDTKGYIRIKLNGVGHVWNQDHVILAPQDASAFYFDPDSTYEFRAHELFTRRKLYGGLSAFSK